MSDWLDVLCDFLMILATAIAITFFICIVMWSMTKDGRTAAKHGVCVNGLLYSADSSGYPTFNRLDADGKPQRCEIEKR